MLNKPALLLAALLLSACGMKSGLTMPPGPAPEPLLGNAKPAKSGTTTTPAEQKR